MSPETEARFQAFTKMSTGRQWLFIIAQIGRVIWLSITTIPAMVRWQSFVKAKRRALWQWMNDRPKWN